MFKELFQTTNKQKENGIAGITGVSVSVTSNSKSAPADKALVKNRSKKDLKNKF